MKKILSIFTLIVALLAMLSLVVYTLYIKPLSEIKELDKWYEYIMAILILTIGYGLFILACKGFLKLIDWAASNI